MSNRRVPKVEIKAQRLSMKELLERRLAQLRNSHMQCVKQIRQLEATRHTFNGAIQECENSLKLLEETNVG